MDDKDKKIIDFFFEQVVPHVIKNRDRLLSIDVKFGTDEFVVDGVIKKKRTGFDDITIKLKPEGT